MGTFLFFILKSSVCLFLFTILYITLLKNITHFRFSRWAFWVGTLFCWLIPLIPVSVSILSPIQQSVMMVGEIFEEIPSDGKRMGCKSGTFTVSTRKIRRNIWSVFVDRYKPLLYYGSCRCILVFCLFFRAVVASYPWQAGAEGRKLPISDSSWKSMFF